MSTATATPTELVQNLFAAFVRGDIAYILASLTPDCRFVVPGEGIPNAGNYVGPEGAGQFFRKLADSEKVTVFEPREYIASGNTVAALGYEEITSLLTGKPARTNWVMVFRVRDGKIESFETFYDTSAYANAHKA